MVFEKRFFEFQNCQKNSISNQHIINTHISTANKNHTGTFQHAQNTIKQANPNAELSCCKSLMKAWCCAWCYMCQIRREQIIQKRLVPMSGNLGVSYHHVPQHANPMQPVAAPNAVVVQHQQPQVVVQQQQPQVVVQHQQQYGVAVQQNQVVYQ